MKALFKRNSPPPAGPLQPALPFPCAEASKEGLLSSRTHFRPRGLSFTKEPLSTPPKVISAPILQVKPSSPEAAYTTTRRRLQSGGITFEEVLPLSFVPDVPALHSSPRLNNGTPATHCAASSPRAIAVAIKLSPIQTYQGATVLDARFPEMPPGPSTPGIHGNSLRQPVNRQRRGTNEVGMHTAHIDGIVSPTLLRHHGLAECLPRPNVMIRRATSLDDVRAYPSSVSPTKGVEATVDAPASPSPVASSQNDVYTDQPGVSAPTELLASPNITSRPRATSTSIVGAVAPRRPALTRAVEMHTSRHSFRNITKNGADMQRPLGMDSGREDDLVRSSLPSGAKKAPGFRPDIASTGRPSVPTPLINAADVFNSTSRGPHTPSSMFSVYPGYARDMNIKVPFPNGPASPRTVLTPPTNPQISMALHVDATRISLGKYKIDQDLTFSIRVQNPVADDVEVELVRIAEGLETVYELKIRKKDPHGMRVRNGIIPYTYVPPFSSASSPSVCSSLCSSPVTTPPLEVPPFHHNGSYFPPQYMPGGTWRTPRRASHVNKGTRSARASSSTVTALLIKARQSVQLNASTPGGNGVASLVVKASPSASGGSRYDSDADDDNDDDDNDNASFLDHYASRGAFMVSALTPVSGTQAAMHPDHVLYGKSAFTTDEDTAEEEGGLDAHRGSSGTRIWRKSSWSDTEPEPETEVNIDLGSSISKGLLAVLI